MLIGRVGAGKTAAMNTILKCSEENEKSASKFQIGVFSDTENCQKEKGHIGRQNVVIVDTPGLCHADKTDEAVMDEIKNGVSLAAPGPHAFLVVLDLERFTNEEKAMVEMIWNTFGKNAAQYAMVLFTHGNDLTKSGISIEKFITLSRYLHDFVSKCNGGYHVIDNKNQDPSQVAELLQHINSLVDKNEGKYYTCEMLEVAKNKEKGAVI